jgi:hypothetical protein
MPCCSRPRSCANQGIRPRAPFPHALDADRTAAIDSDGTFSTVRSASEFVSFFAHCSVTAAIQSMTARKAASLLSQRSSTAGRPHPHQARSRAASFLGRAGTAPRGASLTELGHAGDWCLRNYCVIYAPRRLDSELIFEPLHVRIRDVDRLPELAVVRGLIVRRAASTDLGRMRAVATRRRGRPFRPGRR